MPNPELRIGVLIDQRRAWLYSHRPGREPTVAFILGNVPRKIRRVIEDYMTRRVKSDREKHIGDLYRRVEEFLTGASEIVIFGPGVARDQLAHRLRDNPRFRGVPIRVHPSAWLDETRFEEFARENLHVEAQTPSLYNREPRFKPYRRMGGPGAPVAPEDHRRSSRLKWKDGSMGTGKSS